MRTISKIVAVLCLGVIFLTTGCRNNSLESTKQEKTAVMTIDGLEVPYELYRYVVMNYRAPMEKDLSDAEKEALWNGEEGETRRASLEKNIHDTLIRLYATMSLCRAYNLSPDDEIVTQSVDSQMDALYEEYGNDMTVYRDTLSQNYMNDSVYRFFIRNDVMADLLFSAMCTAGDIETDADMLDALAHSTAMIRVKQILIPADNGKSDEENRSTAEELHKRLENGEDFEALLGEYGGDLFLFNNADGYYIMRGSRYPEFEEAAFSLEIGEISDVVRSVAGYSIIKRYPKEEAYLSTHAEDCQKEYYDTAYNQLVEAHAATLDIVELPVLADYDCTKIS